MGQGEGGSMMPGHGSPQDSLSTLVGSGLWGRPNGPREKAQPQRSPKGAENMAGQELPTGRKTEITLQPAPGAPNCNPSTF